MVTVFMEQELVQDEVGWPTSLAPPPPPPLPFPSAELGLAVAELAVPDAVLVDSNTVLVVSGAVSVFPDPPLFFPDPPLLLPDPPLFFPDAVLVELTELETEVDVEEVVESGFVFPPVESVEFPESVIVHEVATPAPFV